MALSSDEGAGMLAMGIEAMLANGQNERSTRLSLKGEADQSESESERIREGSGSSMEYVCKIAVQGEK